MAHIPQPSAASGIPTTEIKSTDELPTEPTISGIGVPGPDPGEIPEHSGAFNSLDPYLYRQWISCVTIAWTTQMQPGTLLWSTPVSPEIHPILRVLSTIYNVWGGPLEFMLKFCGTGFHAGLVCACRIPPNFHPLDFAGASKAFTAFEYVLMDPKMLEPAEISIRDQRQITYHYVIPEGGSPSSWDIGGHLALYVMDSLSTSSTGASQIQIEILVKAGPGFQFNQMIIPRPKNMDRSMKFPISLSNAFDFSLQKETVVLASSPLIADKLTVLPDSVKELIDGRYNTFNFNGDPTSDFQFGKGYVCMSNSFTGTIANVSGSTCSLVFQDGFWDMHHWQDQILIQTGTLGYTAKYADADFKPLSWKLTDVTKVFPTSEGQEIPTGKCLFAYLPRTQMHSWIMEPKALSAYHPQESIIMFEAQYSGAAKSMQTSEIARLLSLGLYKNTLPRENAALFQLIKVSDNLPLMYVKLYDSGLFTTSASDAQLDFFLHDIKLEFVEYIPRSDKIPSNPSMATNRMLYSLTSSYKRK